MQPGTVVRAASGRKIERADRAGGVAAKLCREGGSGARPTRRGAPEPSATENNPEGSTWPRPATCGPSTSAAPFGLEEPCPRLSWQLPDGTNRQVASALELNGVDLGRTESDASVLVPWRGESVRSRRRVQWRVKVWTDAGESPWSEPAWSETGLLNTSDRIARRIEPQETERSADVLRRTFELPSVRDGARLYATAHGVYETFLNGRRVGDVELAPGFTSYPTTLHVQTYRLGRPAARGPEPVRRRPERRVVASAAPASSSPLTATEHLGLPGAAPRGWERRDDGQRLGVGDRAAPPGRPHGGPKRGPPGRGRRMEGTHRRRSRLRQPGVFARAADVPDVGAEPGAQLGVRAHRVVVAHG